MSLPRPAILGGPPAWPEGPPFWPPLDEAVRAALASAYADGSWGAYHGPHVDALESDLAAYHGVRHALACASGTFAVELALHAVGVGPGDEVALAAYDYPGNFLTIHALGALPVLSDVVPHGVTADVDCLAAALGPKTKAILVSHLHGGLAAMPEIMELARRQRVPVVEDACQCPGAIVSGRKAGTWGDAGVLSFGGSKLLTAGRGGAILTDRADVAQRARLRQFRGNLVAPLSQLQAAVLRPQLAQLDQRNRQRAQSVRQLLDGLDGIAGLAAVHAADPQMAPAYYKLGFLVDSAALGLTSAEFVMALRAEGVAFDEGFRAAHVGRSPTRFRAAGPLPEAERAGRDVVILHHPVLLRGAEAVAAVATAIRKVCLAAEAIRTHLRKTQG